jgi:hypothetical protein
MNPELQSHSKTYSFFPLLRLCLFGGIGGMIGWAHIYWKNQQGATRSEIASYEKKKESMVQEVTERERRIAELLERESLEERLERMGNLDSASLRRIEVESVLPVQRVALLDESGATLAPRTNYYASKGEDFGGEGAESKVAMTDEGGRGGQ